MDNYIGKNSFIHLNLVPRKFFALLFSLPHEDFIEKIDLLVKGFEEKYGIESPELRVLFLLYCDNFENQKNWVKLLAASKKAKKITGLVIKEGSIEHFICDSYIVVALTELGNYIEAKEIIDSINEQYLSLDNQEFEFEKYRIYKSASLVHLKLGKINSSIAAKESALAIAQRTLSFTCHKDKVKTEALELRDLLLRNKEWKSMRNLEDRYNLKKVPKQMDEN